MPDKISKKARSRIMSKIRSKNTQPERTFKKELRKLGIKYRSHYGKEKIDIAIPSRKIAIFIDGCFWHGCPKHGHKPRSNMHYWLPKLRKNKQRDKAKAKRLKAQGWKVIRFWEHQIYRTTDSDVINNLVLRRVK